MDHIKRNLNTYISIFMGILFLISSVFTVICFSSWKKSQKEYEEYKKQVSASDKERNELSAQLEAAISERDLLESKYNVLVEQYDKLVDGENPQDDVDELKAQLEEKQKEIDALKERINNIMSDSPECARIKNELDELLKNGAPLKKVITTDADGNETEELVYPEIAIYYENIEDGYSYSYNADTVFRSASCMKAPFALSLFMSADKEDKAIEAGNKLQDERTYDFERVFTYEEKHYNPGTGKIKDSEYGTQYTHLQLIEYMIKYSDCVALNELLKQYKATSLASLAYSLNTSAMKSDVGSATVADAGKVMIAIHNYIAEGNTHSSAFKSWLVNSAYPYMIPNSLSSYTVAHKYGWDTDSYNDWAIVYSDHPYVITFMSNYDEGGNEFNQYIRKIVKLIDKLNNAYYS